MESFEERKYVVWILANTLADYMIVYYTSRFSLSAWFLWIKDDLFSCEINQLNFYNTDCYKLQ